MVFDNLLNSLEPQDTVAHIGPSVLYERLSYYRNTPAKIVIAEPDPARAAQIIRKIASTDRFKFIEGAVVTEKQRAEMRRYNLDSLTSFSDTGALKKLFPGLQETGRQSVDALSVSRFLQMLPVQHRQRDLLIIDSLSAELGILKEIEAQNALKRFSGVIARIARLAEPGENDRVQQTQDWLAANHFDRAFLLDSADPDLPIFYFQRNELRDELNQQTALVESLRSERDSHRADLDKTRRQAQQAESDLRIATRLHSAAQDDLKDLQHQYSALFADKERQDKLLQQVTRKLAFASDYLHQLAIDAPEFARLMENTRPDTDSGGVDEDNIESSEKPTPPAAREDIQAANGDEQES